MVATIEGPMTAADQLNEASDELARVVKARAKLGYEVESLTETRAVLVTKGRKRMFGMRGGDEQRTEIVIGDDGKAVSRRI
ncbi:MAG TPA: hypothetical protein VF895_10535 [Gaiellaceae bacterium]